MGNTASSQLAEEETLLLLPDSKTEKRIGKLSLKYVDNPEQKWPMSDKPFVFLSQTGRDGVKEDIARPTYWFLTEILQVGAFLDEQTMPRGSSKIEALIGPAYTSTHALVVLSPLYRTREYCVLELNTFMGRLRKGDGLKVIPALWKMNNVEGYHKAVDDLTWIVHEGSPGPVDYMVQTLWPALVRELHRPEMTRHTFEEHLLEYIKTHRGRAYAIPASFEVFASRKGESVKRVQPVADTGMPETRGENFQNDRMIHAVFERSPMARTDYVPVTAYVPVQDPQNLSSTALTPAVMSFTLEPGMFGSPSFVPQPRLPR